MHTFRVTKDMVLPVVRGGQMPRWTHRDIGTLDEMAYYYQARPDLGVIGYVELELYGGDDDMDVILLGPAWSSIEYVSIAPNPAFRRRREKITMDE